MVVVVVVVAAPPLLRTKPWQRRRVPLPPLPRSAIFALATVTVIFILVAAAESDER